MDTQNPSCAGEFKVFSKAFDRVRYVEGDNTKTTNGGLYLICISDSAAATHPVLTYYSVLYYKDA